VRLENVVTGVDLALGHDPVAVLDVGTAAQEAIGLAKPADQLPLESPPISVKPMVVR
jgi:hypothetical protein